MPPRFRIIRRNTLHSRVDLAFKDQIAGARFAHFKGAGSGRRDRPADVVDYFQQFGVTQHDQRHRVVAVEIGVENEIGLITDAGQQIAPSGQHS